MSSLETVMSAQLSIQLSSWMPSDSLTLWRVCIKKYTVRSNAVRSMHNDSDSDNSSASDSNSSRSSVGRSVGRSVSQSVKRERQSWPCVGVIAMVRGWVPVVQVTGNGRASATRRVDCARQIL